MEGSPSGREPVARQSNNWITYGITAGLLGVLFLGVILGPIAIYFGVRARNLAIALNSTGQKKVAIFVIGLGVVDVLFFLIRLVGTIRLIGSGS